MNSIAKLIVTIENQNREYLITEKLVSIGRSDQNLIMINHPTVSRVHAQITMRQDKFYIEDMSRFKRTYLNGESIGQPVELKDQDRIKLGSVNAKFILENMLEPDLLFYEKKHQAEAKGQKAIPTEQLHRVTEVMEMQKRGDSPKRPELKVPEQEMPKDAKPQPTYKIQDIIASPAEELPANEEVDFYPDLDNEDFIEEKPQTAKISDAFFPKPAEGKGSTVKITENALSKYTEESYEIQEIEEDANTTGILAEEVLSESDSHESTGIFAQEVQENIGEEILAPLEDDMVLSADPASPSSIMQAEEKEALIAQAQSYKQETVQNLENLENLLKKEKSQEKDSKASDNDSSFPGWENRKLFPEVVCISANKVLDLKKDVVSIGTENACDLVLENPHWEKIEMLIIRNESDGKYFLKKIGKTETQINGKAVENTSQLKDADIIHSAGQTIYFFDASASLPAFQRALRIAAKNDQKKAFLSPFLEESKRYDVLDGKVAYSFKTFCRDDDYTAFFVKENPYGVYVFLGEIQEKYPNYRLIPWIQGIFDATVDYLEGCSQILKEMNSHIMQTCRFLPLNAMILRINSSEIRYSCAACPAGIYRTAKGNHETLFTKGMPLGLQENYFSEESSVAWQQGDSLLLYSYSCLVNTLQENPKKLLKQEDLARFFFDAMQKQGKRKALESLRQTLEEKVSLSYPFVVSMFTLGNLPSALVCTQCGDKYPVGYKFCPKDGSPLKEEQ
ncbi:MAG: FHA domain-containing protein [Candidatus Brocadiae bacterium]|nr:FHA domain-containing protein [Candidatus Brocadiia bacterium]